MKLRPLLLFALLVSTGCQSVGLPDLTLPTITMPRIGFGEDPEPAIPVSVVYAFDATVTDSTLDTMACGLPLTLNTGELIPQAFLAVGQQRFQSAEAYEGTGEAVRATQSGDLTIQLGMVHQSLTEADRVADEDNYLIFLDMQLDAVILDKDGATLARAPLRFNEQMTVWAPAITGQSVSCATGQYEAAVINAAQDLARQLAGIVPEALPANAPGASPAAARPAEAAPAAVAPAARSSLTFRTRLKDANKNLILEGGETIVLEIEATHSGVRPLEAAHANLEGSPVIVEAFSSITSLPVSLGAFQPGETRTTEIRGRMPRAVREPTGELVVSLTAAGQRTPTRSHRILAPMRDGRADAPAADVPAAEAPAPAEAPVAAEAADQSAAAEPAPASETAPPPGEDYVAVLIGMDAYRDEWPEAYRAPVGHIKDVDTILRETGAFTEPNIRVLAGSHAAKSDVEESLFTWGRQRLGANSVLLVYYSGQAIKNPATGAVYLAPYEGSPDASANRLIALRALQRALGTFGNRLTLLILDAPLIPLNTQADGPDATASRPARWDGELPQQDNPSIIQIRNVPGRGDGLFAGLSGANAATGVTVGAFLKGVSTVSEITPSLPDSSPLLDIPFVPATAAGAEADADSTRETVLPEDNAQDTAAETRSADPATPEDPTSEGPASAPPTVEVPVMEIPDMDAPVMEPPTSEAPTVEAPDTEVPVMDTPDLDAPVMEPPTSEAPVMEAPAVETPASEDSVSETPPLDSPPLDSPPLDSPPLDSPPLDSPPSETPPLETPAAEDSFSDSPASEDLSSDDLSSDDSALDGVTPEDLIADTPASDGTPPTP